jgi:hypothetical protein
MDGPALLIRTLVCLGLLSAGTLAQTASLSLTPGAAGESDPAPQRDDLSPRADRVRFTLTAAGEHIFSASIDDSPGDLAVTRAGLDLRADITLNRAIPENPARATTLSLNLGLTHSWYDFENASGLIPGTDNPFDHVQQYNLSALLLGPITDKWSYQVGGRVESAGAEDADFADTLTYGVFGGAAYSFSRRLTLGAAVLVNTRLEDDALIIPVPVVRWQISDEWLLATLGPRVELSYQESPAWRFGTYVGFGGRSIRLGDDAALPDAVYTETRIPIGAFVEWTPQDLASGALTLRASAAGHLFGSIETLTPSGDEILDTDIDPALGLGLDVVLRF